MQSDASQGNLGWMLIWAKTVNLNGTVSDLPKDADYAKYKMLCFLTFSMNREKFMQFIYCKSGDGLRKNAI